MKSSCVLLAAVGIVAAQQKFLDVVPKCAVECLTQAVRDGTNCTSIDDSQCICEAANYRGIYSVGQVCVIEACGADVATKELLPAASSFCFQVTGGATAPPVDAASSAVSSVASSAAAASGSAAATAASGSASVTGTPTQAASDTAASVATTTTQPGAAAGVGSLGAFGMLALGALAAF
ncbi:hypothetical protein CCHL11_06167 [Colletotrichum chlorophyti]|uniref:CFEM domain-containing protein n=1 Tax=Colletotrichum chlorophyti TaxID=708187 RepID=A0A1Q8RTR6_9PEZI|nr:hypothetical protein CCHL11_06167 [Colletotrichum chlorophyti]